MILQAAIVLAMLAFAAGGGLAEQAAGQQVVLVERPPDPHGTPRPARDARHVPLKTSIYFELGLPKDAKDDRLLADSVAVQLQPQGGRAVDVLQAGRRFAAGASGWLRPRQGLFQPGGTLAVYVEPGEAVRPDTAYTVRVRARSQKGAELAPAAGTWRFTTESATLVHDLRFSLDLRSDPVCWRGAFFSGICNVVFCTRASVFGPTYELMHAARQQHPRAWSYQRDFWMTGTEDRKPTLLNRLPNIVRERETRRITAVEDQPGGTLLRVEDFFGHEQYGIASGRPLAGDYHPGDEVLVADGVHDARAKVIAVDDTARTVLVERIAASQEGWKVAYEGPLPQKEDPDAPGLFPPGGCYLRKFRPHGTPCYYWGRLDKEWDLVHRRYGRRLLVNFADAPGDLAVDGRNWTTAKDYAQWHEVARTVAGHVIDRYGSEALQFTWSVFNEPDLGGFFWRASWDELQRFYDYTVDAILRAFEDRGYDSRRVLVGGLELGGIFGTNLRLTEFLAHCSPRGSAKDALPLNAAFTDPRLDGRRSQRTESLCGPHAGKGSPCDFISIHAYNASRVMAAKLFRAKEMALEIDPEYYRDLRIHSHESCPDWNPPPDEAAGDSYLGNGYFATWCVDVVSRQLGQAVHDPRYASGETLLTAWPPVQNFVGLNSLTRMVSCDEDGDGRADRQVTIPAPEFHVLGMLSDFGEQYWVVPQRELGGHVVGGFASRDGRGVIRVLLYAHHAQDTQSRSDKAFDVSLDLAGAGCQGPMRLEEYRFDREDNSYFRLARALRDRPRGKRAGDSARLEAALRDLESRNPAEQRAALDALHGLGPAASAEAFAVVYGLAESAKDQSVRAAARSLLQRAFEAAYRGEAYSRAEIDEVQRQAACRPTRAAILESQPGGGLRLTARVAGNGLNILVISSPVSRPDTGNQEKAAKRLP